ncbi:MAG TPA: hypothetical protein VIS77_04350 [Burkholderiales bacterium]
MKHARFIAAARLEFLAEGIVIFAVAHHSRHPFYWRPRTRDR